MGTDMVGERKVCVILSWDIPVVYYDCNVKWYVLCYFVHNASVLLPETEIDTEYLQQHGFLGGKYLFESEIYLFLLRLNVYRTYPLSCLWTRQLYRTERLLLQRYPVMTLFSLTGAMENWWRRVDLYILRREEERDIAIKCDSYKLF